MNPKEPEAFVERLERLERDNRSLRWIGSALFLALAGLIAAGPGSLVGGSRLKAHRFELTDSQGRVRASLGFNEEGDAAFRLLDDQGRDQLAMVAREQSTAIDLNQQGRQRMSMLASIDGSSTLQFFSPRSNVPSSLYMWPEGASGLFLSGQQSPVHLATSPNGPPRLTLLDHNFREMGAYHLSPGGGFDWQSDEGSSMVTSQLRTVIENTLATGDEGD